MRFLISNLKLATCIILIFLAETLVDVVITQQHVMIKSSTSDSERAWLFAVGIPDHVIIKTTSREGISIIDLCGHCIKSLPFYNYNLAMYLRFAVKDCPLVLIVKGETDLLDSDIINEAGRDSVIFFHIYLPPDFPLVLQPLTLEFFVLFQAEFSRDACDILAPYRDVVPRHMVATVLKQTYDAFETERTVKDEFRRTGIFPFDHHVMAGSVWCGREKMRPEVGAAGPCDNGPKEEQPELSVSVTDYDNKKVLKLPETLLPEKQLPHGETFPTALMGPIQVSNHRNTGLVDESADSSDDGPLVKMIWKPPTDCHLSERVKTLLKYTDLADVTMKQIYNRVILGAHLKYLSNKKDIIKQTVKEVISLKPRVLIKPYS